VPVSRIRDVYLPAILAPWVLFLYVARIGRGGWQTANLVKPPRTSRRAAFDVLLACAVWVVIEGCEWLANRSFSASAHHSIRSILPATPIEHVAWIALAVSAGFCEEVVYRGYLQTQMTAFTHRAPFGIAIQAAFFGLAHVNQGTHVAFRFCAYGILFGLLAFKRRSLVPGILGHIAIDLTSGFLPH
jgi:membrane protease YdiL (CAAX protease family)